MSSPRTAGLNRMSSLGGLEMGFALLTPDESTHSSASDPAPMQLRSRTRRCSVVTDGPDTPSGRRLLRRAQRSVGVASTAGGTARSAEPDALAAGKRKFLPFVVEKKSDTFTAQLVDDLLKSTKIARSRLHFLSTSRTPG
eukprot:CAMPEP_0180163778 /NCGR_PEP_ID=MMETSP0986-20121125/29992_1 /TAXON_ID=697907 /ORGANISM="non described non described, Strain CCMP2293" /LENGTH=139 /DNA_ID=CAMNT_0022114459 /DNA_START=124 /DNA_END=543 /DNA_ORIENTATION=-